jgi:hypothetical protein
MSPHPNNASREISPISTAGMSIEPGALLTRAMTAAAMTDAGFPITTATLATRATRGGGPPYHLFGKKPLYRWGDVMDWLETRLSPPAASTSEHDARKAA